MSDLFSGFAQELSEKARNANPEPEKQYMGEDGFLHCSICHEPVQMKAPEECRNIFPSGIMDKHCRCVRERIARDEAERKRRKAEERIAELQRICFTDPAYMRHTFEQDKGYSPAARKVAEWYVDTYHERRANNEGLMFMGDTGSMFLGGVVCALGVGCGAEFLMLMAALVYICEALSVVIQVTVFKITKKIYHTKEGKRLFKMTPIHHHFELSGWRTQDRRRILSYRSGTRRGRRTACDEHVCKMTGGHDGSRS